MPYTGLKDCVAAFNRNHKPTEAVSYSKAYRNIRVYGFHTEAVQMASNAPGRVPYCAIVIFTGIGEDQAPAPIQAVTLFAPAVATPTGPASLREYDTPANAPLFQALAACCTSFDAATDRASAEIARICAANTPPADAKTKKAPTPAKPANVAHGAQNTAKAETVGRRLSKRTADR